MWKVEFIGLLLGNIIELMFVIVLFRNFFDSVLELILFFFIKLILSDLLIEEGFWFVFFF